VTFSLLAVLVLILIGAVLVIVLIAVLIAIGILVIHNVLPSSFIFAVFRLSSMLLFLEFILCFKQIAG